MAFGLGTAFAFGCAFGVVVGGLPRGGGLRFFLGLGGGLRRDSEWDTEVVSAGGGGGGGGGEARGEVEGESVERALFEEEGV